MDEYHRGNNRETHECYIKSCLWSSVELTSFCLICNPASSTSTIIGSIFCYTNNCFAYYKYLETLRDPEDQEPKDIIWRTLLLPCYPIYCCLVKIKHPESNINLNFAKICPSIPHTITIVNQPQEESNNSDARHDCPICLSPIEPTDKIYKKCHKFHKKCLDEWKQSNQANANKCPICIQDLT